MSRHTTNVFSISLFASYDTSNAAKNGCTSQSRAVFCQVDCGICVRVQLTKQSFALLREASCKCQSEDDISSALLSFASEDEGRHDVLIQLTYLQRAINFAILHEVSSNYPVVSLDLAGFGVLGKIELDIPQHNPLAPRTGRVLLQYLQMQGGLLKVVVLVHGQPYGYGLLIVVYDRVVPDVALVSAASMLRGRAMWKIPFYEGRS